MSFGYTLQSDHAGAFGVNDRRVPIDSAAVFSADAHVSNLRARDGRLAAPVRG
ncbi:hypothetical protein [Candidatus Burkholderia verschuerenii]|uniref:hypothetical protein n=1 Tax=Candidatus Burkholderia verschuerenii TaxID=242163 RepID=UPI000A495A15|nr:hypothetical protein [Candidatus Burkholderia verschuerenii]